MEKASLRDLYLQHLVNGLPAVLSEVADDGACMPNYWGITNQDAIYSLALAYQTDHAANPFFRQDCVLDACLRVGDYLRRLQDASGKVEFVKVGGSTWGQIYMPWTMYHWLETFYLLQDRLPESRKSKWKDGLSLVMRGVDHEIRGLDTEGVSEQEQFDKNWVFRQPFQVNNISTWNGMSLFRGGQIFGCPEWMKTGSTMVREAARAMDPAGFWPEFGGPTTYYNLISLHAIGLYYAFSRDAGVLPCLEKAVEFQAHFTYPDGRVVETVDGRVRYDDRVQERGHPAFLQSPLGRGYARFLLEQMDREATSTEPPAPVYTVFDLPFFQRKTGTPSNANPFLLAAVQCLDEARASEEIAPPQARWGYLYSVGDRALVRKRGDWFYCLSGFTLRDRESKWAMDRQNHVSLWHRRVGLIVGGGNSQDQPAWSTFVVGPHYAPISGQVQACLSGDAAVLCVGDVQCRVSVATLSQTQAVIVFQVEDESTRKQSRSNITLRLHPWKPIETARGEHFFFTDQPITLQARRIGSWIRHAGWHLTIPPDSVLTWPSFPANPYNPDGASPLCSARGVLSVPHAETNSLRLTFSIEQ